MEQSTCDLQFKPATTTLTWTFVLRSKPHGELKSEGFFFNDNFVFWRIFYII